MPHRTGPRRRGVRVARCRAWRASGCRRWPCARTRRGGGCMPRSEICPLRTPFQRDRDRIVHCKSFRRLKGKTQVFIAPQGDHFRTRLTHTLEVSGISRNVARALRLNEDLTEAVALGHDLGHSPFGHTGEGALDRVLEERYGRGFRHNEHSLRIVDVLEHEGRGLNLTEEVRDGILHHTGDGRAGHAGGRDRPPGRPLRLRQPRHRRRGARRHPRPGRRCPAGPIALLGETRRSGSTRSSTTSSRRPSGRRRSTRPTSTGRRCWSCARSCSTGSTCGPTRASRPARWSGWSRTCWRTSSTTGGAAGVVRGRRRDPRDRLGRWDDRRLCAARARRARRG